MERKCRVVSATAIVLFVLLIVGCGGGGGNADESVVGSSSSTSGSSFQLTLDHQSLSLSSVTIDKNPAAGNVGVVLNTAPPTNLPYLVNVSGAGVAQAQFKWTLPGVGILTITTPSPQTLAPGTYTGVVTITVCTDTACLRPIQGSPATIPVTFTVTTPATSKANFLNYTGVVGAAVHTSDPAPMENLMILVQNVPSDGAYIQLTQPADGLIAKESFTQAFGNSAGVNVDQQLNAMLTLVPPSSLGSGIFHSSVTVMVCFDPQCQYQFQGSPFTVPVDYSVYLTPGKEYSQVTVNTFTDADIAYDSVGAKLYTVGEASGGSGLVTAIDPTTGAAGTPVSLADDLSTVATSDDGSFLYAGARNNAVIHRLLLPSLASDIDIPLGSSGSPQQSNTAAQIAVAPGAPHTIAVALGYPQGFMTSGTVVFDDAVVRAKSIAPLGYNAQPDKIIWGGTASSLYDYQYSYQIPQAADFATVNVDGSGLTITNSVSIDLSKYTLGRAFYAAGRLYDASGSVLDANTATLLGKFIVPSDPNTPNPPLAGILADPSNNRVFLLQPLNDDHNYLYVYNATTFALQSIVDVGPDFGTSMPHMILWGTNGLAFNANGLQILSGSFLAPPVPTGQSHSTRSTFHLERR